MQKVKFFHILIFVPVVVFIYCLSGCKTFTTSQTNQGSIEYDISYPFPEQIKMSADLMPKTMVLKFNERFTLSEISAGLGVFNTYIITDTNQKTIVQRLKVMGKKYKVTYDSLQIDSIIKSEPEMKMEVTPEVKKIAGYKCKKVICNFTNPSIKPIEVFVTDDIAPDQNNWYSVYRGLKGTLMEFYINRYGITMKLTAKNVSEEGVESGTFSEDEEYKTIPYSEMDSYFKMY